MNVESLPGCFGYYPKAIFPNDCRNCPTMELCKKFIAKEKLLPVLNAVKEARLIIRGEKVE